MIQRCVDKFVIWMWPDGTLKTGTTTVKVIMKKDGSASKPVLRPDASYMVEKTYHDIAPHLGAFGAYLMPQ